MKVKLARFEEFVNSLYPSEVAYILENNQFSDPELFNILAKIQQKVNQPTAQVEFDASIDPRKYSKLIKYFRQKLQRIDVDQYYTWINNFNYQVTLDVIPPDEQTKVLAEVRNFDPRGYHSDVFYQTMEVYKKYLIIRGRFKDLGVIKDFLQRYRVVYELNRSTMLHVETITERLVLNQHKEHPAVSTHEISEMLITYKNENLSKKTRYAALLAYIMYNINHDDVNKLVEPMREHEKAIYHGEFYSPRLLANFYANKLLVLDKLGAFQEAAFCGALSIRQHTQDFLYYLNNYTTVLIHLKKYKHALSKMKVSFEEFKKTRNLNNKMVFITNYCRCLNESKQFNNTVRLMRNYLEEFNTRTFEHRWNYFFRTYLYALVMNGQNALALRINRKYNLVEREQEILHIPPYIHLLITSAEFNELKIGKPEYELRMQYFQNHPLANLRLDFRAWLGETRHKN